jgi:hypothetical protein
VTLAEKTEFLLGTNIAENKLKNGIIAKKAVV